MIKKFRVLLIVLALLLIIVIGYISTLEIMSVNKAVDEFNNKFSAKSEKTGIGYVASADSMLTAKQYQHAYLASQIEAAKSDSITLLLNFPDSVVDLMIKGVTVHSAKIETYKLSQFIGAVNRVALYNVLSSPLQVTEHKSTIKKVPLMVKIAPKDTSEYTPDIIPDTTDTDAVNFIFETNAGIQLYFYESNPKESADGMQQFKFDFRDKLQTGYRLFISAFTFTKITYQPEIRIRLKKKDAKIIYRALPENASIVLRVK